jgi:hypothetical protein
MNQEQLEQANRLKTVIDLAKAHKKSLIDKREHIKKSSDVPALFFGKSNNNSYAIELFDDIAPVTVSAFMDLYLLKVDEYIAAKEKEFSTI